MRAHLTPSAAGHPFDDVPGLPCRDVDDPDMFWPDTGSSGKAGRDICNLQCPIRAACLTFAIDTSQFHGTWGGYAGSTRKAWSVPARRAIAQVGRPQLELIERGEIDAALALSEVGR
jgi:hypothetical protein